MTERSSQYAHDGLVFDVRDVGPLDAPVVVALHGFPQTSSSWDAVGARLAAAGRRVLAPDQRGYSPRARPQDIAAYALPRLVDDVLKLVDAVGVEQVDLLGHDWGGAVAWALAAYHPDRVRTLTVASTPHPRALTASMRHGQALRSWYIGMFAVPGLAETLFGTPAVARRLLGAMSTPHPEQVQAFLADRATARATLSWYRAALGGILGRGDPPPVVRVPTTYVWSDGDPALGRWATEHTGAYVDADYRFVVLEGVGHWIPDERPDELAAAALERMDGSRAR